MNNLDFHKECEVQASVCESDTGLFLSVFCEHKTQTDSGWFMRKVELAREPVLRAVKSSEALSVLLDRVKSDRYQLGSESLTSIDPTA